MKFLHEASGQTVTRDPATENHTITYTGGGSTLVHILEEDGYKAATVAWATNEQPVDPAAHEAATALLSEISNGLREGQRLPWAGFLPVVEG